MSDYCPTCGRPIDPQPHRLSESELNALSAWWATGSVRAAANLLVLSEQTVKNHLYNARVRHGLHKTTDLVQLYFARLRSKGELVAQHNLHKGEAA